MLTDDEFEAVLRRAMVLMLRVDGHVDEDEIVRIRWLMKTQCNTVLGADEVREFVNAQVVDDTRLDTLLAEHRERLSPTQRTSILEVAFAVASADGTIADDEDALLVCIAKSLKIDPMEYRDLLSQARVTRLLT